MEPITMNERNNIATVIDVAKPIQEAPDLSSL
jgi:hypothetical protein